MREVRKTNDFLFYVQSCTFTLQLLHKVNYDMNGTLAVQTSMVLIEIERFSCQ